MGVIQHTAFLIFPLHTQSTLRLPVILGKLQDIRDHIYMYIACPRLTEHNSTKGALRFVTRLTCALVYTQEKQTLKLSLSCWFGLSNDMFWNGFMTEKTRSTTIITGVTVRSTSTHVYAHTDNKHFKSRKGHVLSLCARACTCVSACVCVFKVNFWKRNRNRSLSEVKDNGMNEWDVTKRTDRQTDRHTHTQTHRNIRPRPLFSPHPTCPFINSLLEGVNEWCVGNAPRVSWWMDGVAREWSWWAHIIIGACLGTLETYHIQPYVCS